MSSNLASLLASAKQLTPLQQRKVASVVGACVADAASRPLHWVYNMDNLDSYLKSNLGGVDRTLHPEFFPESRSPFYSLPTGSNSCYYDTTQSALNSLHKNSNAYSLTHLCDQLIEDFFGASSAYNGEQRQQYMKQKSEGGSPGPFNGKWMHGSLFQFKENKEAGKDEHFGGQIKETDGFCLALPIILLQSTSDGSASDVDKITEQLIKTLSQWPTSISHGLVAGRIIWKLLNTEDAMTDVIGQVKKDIASQFPDVAESMQTVDANMSTEHYTAVGDVFGRPCYNPGSFQGALHAVQTSSDFSSAVRATIRAGGCNCSRALFIGAMWGARHGLDSIPEEWMGKTTGVEKVIEMAMKVYS